MPRSPQERKRSPHTLSWTPLLIGVPLSLALAACQSAPPPLSPPAKISQSTARDKPRPRATTRPTTTRATVQDVKPTTPAPKATPTLQKLPGRAIPKQIFQVELSPFGKTTFTPREITDGPGSLALFLTRGSKILYRFPKPRGISWAFDSLVAVSFRDINKDSRKDVLLITKYMSGVGPGGAEPFFVTQIYLNDAGAFHEDPSLVKKLLATAKIHTLRKLTTPARRFFKHAKKAP